jgi:hypothetical protein
MFKEFLTPDLRKIIVYLLFVIVFMSETLMLLSVYKENYIISFISNVYRNFFGGAEDSINFFTVAFVYYIVFLVGLYLLSCLVISIFDKIGK